MDVIFLGGQNPRHLAWSQRFAQAFESRGHSVRIVTYENWLDGSAVTDVETEVAATAAAAAQLPQGHRPVLVAKSIGTVIATLATGRGLVDPSGALFLGMPLEAFESRAEAVGALAGMPRLIAVQNEHDPFGAAADVEAFVRENGPLNSSVHAVPGVHTHDYDDFDPLVDLAETLA